MPILMPKPAGTVTGLILSISIPTALAGFVSFVLIFVLSGGPGSIDAELPTSGPIGRLISQIVPVVWLGLFGGLGASYWSVARKSSRTDPALLAIYVLILICSIYPIIAFAVENPLVAIVGNILTIVASIVTAALCWRVSGGAAVWPVLVALWVCLATLSLLALYTQVPF